MILANTQPSIPVHRFRNRLAHWHVFDIRVPAVPAARTVHVCCNGCHIFDDTRFFPGFKLEVIGFGVALVTHLGDYSVFLGSTHHHFDLVEGTCHRFFYINVFSVCHGFNSDREVRMVGDTHCNRIDLVCHLVKHLPEVLETRYFREHRDQFLRMLGSHIHITEGDYVTQSGIV